MHLYHRYDYDFPPGQLAALIGFLDEGLVTPGSVLEVGCGYGHTTVLMSMHLHSRGERRRHICVDTFSGFTREDASFEAEHRGKSADYAKLWADVTMKTFQRNLENNGVVDVEAIVADVNDFDFARVGPIAFALLDVDLYRPMKRAIAETYGLLSPGGVIVCDDCTTQLDAYDGALQAYNEFVEDRGLSPEIVEGSLGILRGQ
jgi:O-methyltransferase